jgi:hypothetical protein
MAINARYRDKNGEIGRKHGNTLIGTLRKTYGVSFAWGRRDDEKLTDVLPNIDEHSLRGLLREHQRGRLDEICEQAA